VHARTVGSMLIDVLQVPITGEWDPSAVTNTE
jgi:hypothetical protein